MTLDPTKFSDEELDAIGANGCGSKGGWIKVPNFCWADDCNGHDIGYWIGGDNIKRNWLGIKINLDRLQDDRDFLDAMLSRCDEADHGGHGLMAWAYYRAVRMFGGKYYHKGPKQTRADLDAAVESHRRSRRGK